MGDKPGVNARPREKVAAEAADAERLWGINSVWEALQQHGRGLEDVLIERGKAGPRLQQIIDLARQQGVSVRFVDADRLGVSRHCRHQGVVARQSAAPLLQLEELLDDLEAAAAPPRLLALDSIQDPQFDWSREMISSQWYAGPGHRGGSTYKVENGRIVMVSNMEKFTEGDHERWVIWGMKDGRLQPVQEKRMPLPTDH